MKKIQNDPEVLLPNEVILNKISVFRNKMALLDRDLAPFYGIDTRELKRRVRRNKERFPTGSVFELSYEENKILMYQYGALKRGKHAKHPPMVFTERGILAFSGLVNNRTAATVTLQILTLFFRLNQLYAGVALVGIGRSWHGVTPEGDTIPPYALLSRLHNGEINAGEINAF